MVTMRSFNVKIPATKQRLQGLPSSPHPHLPPCASSTSPLRTLSSMKAATSSWVKGRAESSSRRNEWEAAEAADSTISAFILLSTSWLTVSVPYLWEERGGNPGSGVGRAWGQTLEC